ncbi:hypothetical protein BC834DRAFT_902893 [Gloeopeniophorella convolvens]|nr:hypothetical protein BC834DRAFT_902893 [Gloeopeniophorella convolvens]
MSRERSASRGRPAALQSSGRGGAGNIRSASASRDRTAAGPDDFSDTRGRDPVPGRDPGEVISTGRGGAGNIRSPSRGTPREASTEPRGRGYDRDLISAIDNAHDTGVHSSGRGGAGNIVHPGTPPADSKSRSRSRGLVHSSGRGGAGNIHADEATERNILEVDESERAAHQHAPGVHSTGRGGLANLTAGALPHSEGAVHPHAADHPHVTHSHEYESTGRGGAGNISRSRSQSRDPSHKEPGHKDHGLAALLHRIGHHSEHKDEPHANGEELPAVGVEGRQPAL